MSNIESVLKENRVFQPNEDFVKQATLSGQAAYDTLCHQAEADYEGFWANLANEQLLWHKPFSMVLDDANPPFFKWFHDGELNVSYNCLDRHLKTIPNKTALIFEADDGSVTKVTYKQLYHRVCQMANGLKSLGIRPGDRVVIYMPMSIEGVAAMQACARIGATHSVVFGGFSAKSLQERIIDVGATAVITADAQIRGGKEIPLKPIVDEAIAIGGCEKSVMLWCINEQATKSILLIAETCGYMNLPRMSPTFANLYGLTQNIPYSSFIPQALQVNQRVCSTARPVIYCMRY